MATATVTINGYAYANGGWVKGLNNPAQYDPIGSLTGYIGKNPNNNNVTCMTLLKITLPTVTGPEASRSLKIKIPLSRSSGGLTYGNVTCTVTDAGRTETGYFSHPTIRGNVIASQTRAVSGLVYGSATQVEFNPTGSGTLKSGGTYYVWLTANTFLLALGSGYSATLTYTAATAVTAPSNLKINGTTANVNKKPGEKITLSWTAGKAGSANAVTGYYVQRKINTGAWTNVGRVTSGTSITITLGAARGDRYYFRVRTEGAAGSSYYSAYVATSNYASVNTLPSRPTVSASRGVVPSGGGDVVFTLSGAGSGEGYYFSYTATGTKYYASSKKTITMSSTRKTIYFFIYDGLEYGGYTAKTITINTKPVVNSITTNAKVLPGNSGASGVPLANHITSVTRSLNKTVTSYRWYLEHSASSSMSGSTQVSLSSNSTLGTVHPNNYSGMSHGRWYRFALKVWDGYEWSDLKVGSIFRIPYALGQATIERVYNQTDSLADVPYTNQYEFEKGLSVEWTNPSVGVGQTTIKETNLVYKYTSNNGASYYSGPHKTTSASLAAGATTFHSAAINIPRGHKVQLEVWVTDQAGNLSVAKHLDSNQKDILYMRAQAPILPSALQMTGPVSDNQITIRPYTNETSVEFRTANAQSNNGTNWYIRTSIPNKESFYIIEDTSPTIKAGTAIFTINSDTINNILKNDALKPANSSIWNEIYTNVQYEMFVVDNFGIISNIILTEDTIIDFREAPILSDGNIKIGINYYPSASSTDYTLYPSVAADQDAATINNDRMILSGEAAVLEFKEATDLNHDIQKYRVRIARFDERPSFIVGGENFSSYSFVDFLTIEASDLQTKLGMAYIEAPLTVGKNNEFVVFELTAIDSTLLESNKIYSNTYLVLGATKAATLEVSSPSLSVSGDNHKLKISYHITDLGAGSFLNPEYVYSGGSSPLNNYPFFQRNLQFIIDDEAVVYEPNGYMEIQWTLDGNFENLSTNNYGSYITTISSLKSTLLTDSLNEIFKNKRLFIRVKFIVSIGIGETIYENLPNRKVIITDSIVQLLYIDVPTMSYRKNAIGINADMSEIIDSHRAEPTGDQTKGDIVEEKVPIFFVQDFGDRRKVIFCGIDAELGPNEIVFDLKTGHIDGSILDGGEW